MDRTVGKKTTLEKQDEAFCLSLTIDERLKVLEELNRIGRVAAGYPEARLDRPIVHAAMNRNVLRVVSDRVACLADDAEEGF